jgi:hypothetical protein
MEAMQAEKMKTRGLIPFGREIRFIAIITLTVLITSLAGVGLIAVFFNREMGTGFAEAFFTIRSLYANLNAISALAILLQLTASVIIIYVAALRYSHKISGPMFRFKVILGDYVAGNPVKRIGFRTDDFLKPLAHMLKSVIDSDQKRRMNEEVILKLLGTEIPQEEAQRALHIRKLRELLETMETENAQ